MIAPTFSLAQAVDADRDHIARCNADLLDGQGIKGRGPVRRLLVSASTT